MDDRAGQGREQDALQRRLRQQAERCTQRALARYTPWLREQAQRSQPPTSVDSLIAVLSNASDRHIGFGGDELRDYTHALVEVVTDIGAGSELRGEVRLLDLFEKVGTELYGAGRSTTDLRLITARFSSLISNGGQRRLALIERALQEARTDDERLRATLVAAKYYIDISDYAEAHRRLDECEALAARAPTGSAQGFDIHTTRGVIHFYSNHALAMRSLRRGISVKHAATDPVVCRATATALHYLGRIRAARGHHDLALALIVLAQHYKTNIHVEGTQLGFYHLRMGEMLTSAGLLEQGQHHLEQAGRVFQHVRQRSAAEAQLTSAIAGIVAAYGERDRAEQLLLHAVEAARRDRYPRGEVLFQVQLLKLYARRGAIVPAVHSCWRLLAQWRATELNNWTWIAHQIRSSTFGKSLVGRRRKSKLRPQTCPCPLHGATSIAELTRSAGLRPMETDEQADT